MKFEKRHVEEAFKLLRANGLHPNKQSTKWDVVDPKTGERFPPKAVLRVAKALAKDSSWSGGGGPQTNMPLKQRGFAPILKRGLETSEAVEDIQNVLSAPLDETTKRRLINARIGQGGFREELMEIWEQRCALTGCSVVEVLRASHIKPWRESSNAERLDAFNGLLLAASIDALFDRFLICFDQNGALMVSSKIDSDALKSLGLKSGQRIKPYIENKPFLKWHFERSKSMNDSELVKF